MKHEQIVEKYRSMGFRVAEIFPAAKTTILEKDGIFVTIKNGKVRNGHHGQE